VLVPAGDHWRVGLRYACPSAAASKGRALPEHQEALTAFAAGLAEREKLQPRPDGSLAAPPPIDSGDKLDWPDTLRLVDALMKLLLNRKDAVERRARKCLHLAGQMRKAKLAEVRGAKLTELLALLSSAADAEVPASPMQVAPPGWVGRVLFRQAAALFTRKDRGPNRGEAIGGVLARIGAALRFARSKGRIPRLHRQVPEATFEDAEVPRGPLPADAEGALERYYAIKVGSLQFCGSPSFGMPFWEGLEALLLTLPIVLWLSRTYRDVPREQAVVTAVTIVDDHVGFNRVLGTFRQRLSFSLIARTGELSRLIAWYSR
jgi:lysine-N-methylase